MMKQLRILLVLTTVLIPPAFGKGATLRIIFEGKEFTRKIDKGVRDFSIWEGPGTFRDGVEATEGFIIEWQRGILKDAERAAVEKLSIYEVAFEIGCPPEDACIDNGERSYYRVRYAFDREQGRGYVFLPTTNQMMWHGHGYEGNWLRATAEWDRFATEHLKSGK